MSWDADQLKHSCGKQSCLANPVRPWVSTDSHSSESSHSFVEAMCTQKRVALRSSRTTLKRCVLLSRSRFTLFVPEGFGISAQICSRARGPSASKSATLLNQADSREAPSPAAVTDPGMQLRRGNVAKLGLEARRELGQLVPRTRRNTAFFWFDHSRVNLCIYDTVV